MVSYVDPRAAVCYGDCSESMPSSAASEDTLDLPEADISLSRLQNAVSVLLQGIGEDVEREGLRETPRRVAKAWSDATEGYRQSTSSVLGGALFHEDFSSRRDNSMVIIQDVDFASTSEHTLLPFYGRCHIAYVPRNGVVLGLSKVARLSKMFARRLQNQHRFTQQLLEAFNAEVQPLGCSAIVEARHLGREQATSTTLTAALLGCFCTQPKIYLQEFVSLLGHGEEFLASLSLRSADSTSSSGPLSLAAAESEMQGAVSRGQAGQEEEDMVAAVESVLRELGEDLQREGLQGTARRYVRHLMASTSGGEGATLPDVASSSPEEAQEYEILFTSQCEHHLLPFQGTLQIVYLPGLSGRRLSRSRATAITLAFSRRLQIQERLTHQVAASVSSELQASGVLVLCRAAHMCMVARGVEQHSSSTATMAAYGAFESDPILRGQVLHGLRPRQPHPSRRQALR